jgi:hypothetical protein
MRYRCHQCFGVIEFEAIAHMDIYADLCWIQCDVCQQAFGRTCGLDRRANPNPHGYLACPLRRDIVSPLLRPPVHLLTSQ